MLEKVDGLAKTVVNDYFKNIDRNKLRYRQLHLQNYIDDSSPSNLDEVYNDRSKYGWIGVVYRITELREENGKIVDGRIRYGFATDSLESRWDWYKSYASDPNLINQPIHDAILAIKNKYRVHNIDNWFKREVIEIHWDENSLRQREDYWIQKDKTQDPAIGFNILGGGVGGSRISIPLRLLVEYIAKGLKPTDIKNELKNHGIYLSRKTVSRRINEYFGSFLEARVRFLKPVIWQLIKEGYIKQDIEAGFGVKGGNIIRRWIPKLFGVPTYTALRESYLLRALSTILETGVQDLTYGKLHSFLPQFGKFEIVHLIEGKWSGILNAKIHFAREIAIRLFRRGASDGYILKVLGYSEGTISREAKRERIFKRLFNGMTADEAREHFTSEYKNVENHFKWYSDLDNY